MFDCVVDTNIAVKWVLAESDSAVALRVMHDVLMKGGVLHLLDIALVEAANVFRTNYHRGKLSLAEARDRLVELRLCPIVNLPAEPLLTDALDIALRFNIAVYDACFVAAVQKLGCRGVTADAPLVKKVGTAFPSIILLKDW